MKTILASLTILMFLTVPAAGGTHAAAGEQRVKIAVTEEGFVPSTVTVRAGRPVTLLVTRRTDRTCATALVLKAYGIHAQLPRGRTVAIRFTPERRGELTYACPMNMIHGRILVR